MVAKVIEDYSAVMRQFDVRKLPQFTYHSNSMKPVKAVILHLPKDTAAEDVWNKLVALGFSVISVHQKTASKQQPVGGKQLSPATRNHQRYSS